MKKINFLLFLFFMISSLNEISAQQTLSYTKCVLINAGSASYFNYHKTFTSVSQATSDVQLVVSFLACNPYSVNTAGIQLSGTTFIQPNVPAGNCSYVNTTYTIDKNVFNQAVTAGAGSITFDFYVRDQCASGYGCSSASDPCIKINLTIDTTCVPTSGTDTVTSCGPYTWIDGNTYTTNNNTATHVLTNAGGCDSTVTLNLTIGDFQAPVPDQTTLSEIHAQCSVTALTAPTATDNCAGTITGTHNATLPITSPGTTVVTWTYTDGNGNSSTQTQNIIIADTISPIPDLTALPDVTAQCSVGTLVAPTASDNCSGTITGTHNAVLPITNQGTTVVTWTYTDGKGNSSTQTQNIVVADNTVPVPDITSLPAITAECSVATLTAPTATDNCAGTITGTHNAVLPITNQGTTIVTWTYNDGNGNTATQTQNVVIADVTAPVADLSSLSPVTTECSIPSLTAPTATDNCSGSITGTPNVTFPITAQGTFVITWTYNDGHGNSSTQTQQITIDDQTAPVANNAILPQISQDCEITSLVAPTATDNCAGTVTGVSNVSLPITTLGTTTITWTYNDGNGNSSSQTQTVVVTDNLAPVPDLTSLPDLYAECSVSSLTAPTATDNCSGQITATSNVSFPITTLGTTIVNWTFDDGHGNISTQNQNVIILDTIAPVADLATLPNLSGECEVSSLTAPTATDDCVGQITGTSNVNLPITAVGTTTITWTFDDGRGNVSTQNQQVIITAIDNDVTEIDGITLQANAIGYTYQWVDCANGNAPVSGETNQTFSPMIAGNYACEISNGTCTILSECTSLTLGISENMLNSKITVYPNPTSSKVSVALNETMANVTVTIRNLLGEEIEKTEIGTTNQFEVMLPGEPGVYFLEIQSEGKKAVFEVVKN